MIHSLSSPQFPLFPLVLPSSFCNFCYLPGTSGNLTFQSLSTQLSLNLEKCYSRPSKIWSLCTFQARPFVHPSFSQSALSFDSLNILCISEFHVFVPFLFFLVSLARGLLLLFILSKNQLLVLLIFFFPLLSLFPPSCQH